VFSISRSRFFLLKGELAEKPVSTIRTSVSTCEEIIFAFFKREETLAVGVFGVVES
jgi:hypothetical protein